MDIRSLSGGLPTTQGTTPTPRAEGAGFNKLMDTLRENVVQPQQQADQAILELSMGHTDQLHQVLLSVAKADLAFRLMLEVRNKLTEAYQEVQRMQI